MGQIVNRTAFSWTMENSPASKIRYFSVKPRAMERIRSIDHESRWMNKETGGVICASLSPDRSKISIENLIEIRPNELHSDMYSMDSRAVKNANDVYCGGSTPIVDFHTHPNGYLGPSKQDRIVSVDTNTVGCVISRSDVACYFGNNDLYPVS